MHPTEAAESVSAAGADAAAWSRYWARGALHSCPQAFAGNYDGEIRALWSDFVASLPADARVLDIGTGNGAVALLAAQAARALGRQVTIAAIDAADIDPRRAAAAHGLPADGIRFRGRTACENTGFPGAHFDGVTSQYALEYSRVDAAIAELARVLKPGGRALCVVHHAASAAIETTRAELDAFRFLKHEAPLLAEARRSMRALSTRAVQGRGRAAPETRSGLRPLEGMLHRAMRRARERPHAAFLEGIAAQVAAAVREAAAGNSRAGMQRLEVLAAEMAAHERRLAAMVRAARDEVEIARLRAEFDAAGFETQPPSTLSVRGNDVVGWVLRASTRNRRSP